MGKYSEVYQKIILKLNKLRKREKKARLFEGILVFIFGALITISSVLLFEAMVELPVVARLILSILMFLILAGTFIWYVLRPLFYIIFKANWPDEISLALEVGKHFHYIRDRLANALQLFHKHQNNREGYSLELADASLLSVEKEVRNLDFAEVLDFSPVKKWSRWTLISTVLFIILVLAFPSRFTEGAFRLLNPLHDFNKAESLFFQVVPGNVEIVKGENVHVQAKVSGPQLVELGFGYKKSEAAEYELRKLKRQQDGTFNYIFENVREPISYYFYSKKHRSDLYTISVVELPFMRNLQISLKYPQYTKLGTQFLEENVGDVTALKGTKINFTGIVNKPLQSAELIFDDGKKIPLQISGTHLRGNFTLLKEGSYHINLIDQQNRKNAHPIEYRLSVIEDEFPFVQITFPGRDIDLNENMQVPLTIEAQDDFGFSRIRLAYKILKQGFKENGVHYLNIPLSDQPSEKLILNYKWDMSKLNIFPEDVVSYYVEVFDNDRVSGPKRSRSLTYRVRFPSLYEIYEEVAKGHEETFENLEDIYEQGETLRKELKEIMQEMKRDPELNWEQKQKVQEALKTQEDLQNKLQEVQQKLEEVVKRLEQNDLLSAELLQKYQELQQLLEEVLTPELKEALRELQKSLEQMDPQKLKEAMEKFATSQEEFLKSIERTMNLLKQLHIEQKLEESIKKAQDLLRRQKELNKQLAQSPQKSKKSKYAQQQKGIRQDAADLKKELSELKEKMNEFPQMPQDRIEAAENMLSESQLQSEMQRAIQQLQSGNFSRAQQSGQQIQQNLQELLESLQTAQKELSEKQKKELMEAFNRSAHNLLTLSELQEKLMQTTQKLDPNSPGMGEAADKQQDLLSGLSRITNQLYELSQKTFFITPEMGKALGKALSGMQQSIQSFEGRDVKNSLRNQGKAMAGLNEAAKQLRDAMQNMSGASSAIGFQEMMQRLMGISQQQQGINQQTEQLGKKPGMSLEEQAAMQRLAAEQETVRKSLEQLRKEFGNRSEILGDLQKISEDMKEVVKDLEKQNISRNTINRQKRILSRLLDAQRSVHRRDFSKKRQAETAKEYEAVNPAPLPEEKLQEKDLLKEALLKALKEGYSKDYKELIKKYFEAISKETVNN